MQSETSACLMTVL